MATLRSGTTQRVRWRLKCYTYKFHDFTIPPNGNRIEALHALEDTNNLMAEKGMGIPDTFPHARFILALPDEHGRVKATLQAMKYRGQADIIRMVVMRYSTLPQRAKAAAGVVRDEVVAAVSWAPRALATAGAAARVEVAAARAEEPAAGEAGAAPVVPAVVATAAVADLMAAVGDAVGGTTSSVLGVRVLAMRAHVLIGRGGGGDGAADVRSESRRGSPSGCDERNGQGQSDGRRRARRWRARQAGRAVYR